MAETAKFAASFRGPRSHTEPRRVRISRIARARAGLAEHSHLDEVEIHTSVPPSASCFLQVWEADHFAVHYTNPRQAGDAPQAVRENRLIASFPGAIVKSGDTYTFVSMGASQHRSTFDAHKGHITVRLETDLGGEVDTLLPLPEYEGVLELIGVIKAVSNDSSLSTFQHAKPHQVHNVGATVLAQIRDRGGLHMSFVADYDFNNASSNDKEFRRQADAMIAQMPSLIVEDGKVAFGRLEIDNWHDMAGHIEALRSTAQREFALDTKPPIASIGLFAHGVTRGVRVASTYDSNNSPNIRNVAGFVDSLRPHLSANFTMALYSCNAGRGGGITANHRSLRDKQGAKNIYGRVLVGEERGGDSFAWHLYRELRRHIAFPTVWAHTIAAHTTRNRRKRVFCPLGSADLPTLLFGVRQPTDGGIESYLSSTQAQTAYLNLLRMVSVSSGMYFDWAWSGGHNDVRKLPGYTAVEHERVEALVEEIRGVVLASNARAGEERALNVELDSSGRFVLRSLLTGATVTTRLSDDFKLEDFSGFTDGLPLPVELVRKLQMLRYRTQKSLTVGGIIPRSDAGARGVRLQVRERDMEQVLEKARTMVDEGLFFTSATRVSDTELELLGPNIPGPT